MSIEELLRKFDAGVLDELNIGFQTAIQRHRDSPWARKNLRILNRHLVANGVRMDGREAKDRLYEQFARTGKAWVSGEVVEPSPTCPALLNPQQYAAPLVVSPQV